MRVKLSEKYQIEREEICKRLIEILDLDSNNSFILFELDNDTEKQNKLMNMKEEIQKYFACSTFLAFKPNVACKRPCLSIIRNILRKQNYHFIGNDYTMKINNIPKKTIKYIIFKNN